MARADEVLERRIAPRAFFKTGASFQAENYFFTGFTEDVSGGGLSLATYDLMKMGADVEVEFTLLDGHIVRAAGVVRWIRDLRNEEAGAPPGMGIEFRDLAPVDRDAINLFVASRGALAPKVKG